MQPSSRPSAQPSLRPSAQPSRRPSAQPSHRPSAQPTSRPSRQPSSQPSCQPSSRPSSQPTSEPTRPSVTPTFSPYFPSAKPTILSSEIVEVAVRYNFHSVKAVNLTDISVVTIVSAIQELAPQHGTVTADDVNIYLIGAQSRKLTVEEEEKQEESEHLSKRASLRAEILDIKLYSFGADATIHYNLVSFPGQNATTVAKQQSELITLVGNNGTFQNVLRRLAMSNNATQLFNVTVKQVTANPTIIPPPSAMPTQAAYTARLTVGQITGLVIGTVIGTACLLSIVYCFVITKRAHSKFNDNSYDVSVNKATGTGGKFDETIKISVGDDQAGREVTKLKSREL